MKRITITSIAAIMLGSAAPSFAATATGSFDVGIEVIATCSISASNLTFNTITTGTTTNNDATSSLTVNCSNGAPYTIALGNGANYSNVRRMAWGASHIEYALYQDAARSTQWHSSSTKGSTGSGADQTYTVYGRIPSSQSVTNTGSYGDTVIATVSY
jgi:spore coat protein U-like protein